MVEQANDDAPPVTYEWRLINKMRETLDVPGVSAATKAQNDAYILILTDRMVEIAHKSCYVCDGYGHVAEACPTSQIVRDIASKAGFPVLKGCITNSLAAMKVEGFRHVLSQPRG